MEPTGFDAAFDFVVGNEGGYVNDPKDPGGETKYGISKRFNPDVNIKTLTLDQAKAIYFKRYWTPAGCGSIKDKRMSILSFDAAVNQGVGNAVLWTGQANSTPDPTDTLLAARIAQYTQSPNWPTYARD